MSETYRKLDYWIVRCEFTLEPPSTYRLLTRLSEAGFVGLVEPEDSSHWFEESAQ